MHASDLRKNGESEIRIYLLNAWREATVFTDRERAAFAWAETLTNVAENGAPDADYALIKEQFTEAEQAKLTFAIGAINLWNRLQIGVAATHPAL